ncbi:MAG: alpha/beta fold hydrolase [Myxococcaceae bacterium]|nr:alpha/beta fold hydrolase [Myxococcaceae bacterium]
MTGLATLSRVVRWGLAASLVTCGTGCLSHHQGAMKGEPIEATFLTIEGTRVRYLDVGQGPPVVLLHGFASAIENWAGVIPELKQKHRVLALDLKGFGWTDRPVGDYSPAAQAAVVKALMKERGIDKAAIVAHSWGSSVALAFALAWPEAVDRIALYDAWVYEQQLPSMFQLARAKGLGEFLFAAFYSERGEERLANGFYDPEIIPEKLVEDVEQAMERPGTRAAALEAVRGMRFSDVEAKYSTISHPTLLLWGREDIVTPPSIGERLVRQLRNARLVVYPRCGHFPMIEALAESNRELLTFLEGQ